MSDNCNVLVIRSSSDKGSEIIAKSFELVTELFGLHTETCFYEDIVLPDKEIKRFPAEPGDEWGIKRVIGDHKKLSCFQVYVFLVLSDDSSTNALKVLTLRGSQRIFSGKQVVLIDPEQKISLSGIPNIFDLFSPDCQFTSLLDHFQKQENKEKIANLFAQLMSEVDHSDRP